MNPESFTYNGVTVSYSEAQKAIVLADQNLITQLKAQYASLQDSYNAQEALVNDAKNHLDNYCNTLSGSVFSGNPRQQCIDTYNRQWNTARATELDIQGQMNTNGLQQASAVKKLNDDITTIENDIKLQIQTQLANTAAANAAANQQSTVSTAPAIVAANAAAVQTQLANEAAAAKLKQEQNIKLAEFGVIAVVIVVIGIFVVKKLF